MIPRTGSVSCYGTYKLRPSLFYALVNDTWGTKTRNGCSRSTSQRASSQYVKVHGHVAYGHLPFVLIKLRVFFLQRAA